MPSSYLLYKNNIGDPQVNQVKMMRTMYFIGCLKPVSWKCLKLNIYLISYLHKMFLRSTAYPGTYHIAFRIMKQILTGRMIRGKIFIFHSSWFRFDIYLGTYLILLASKIPQTNAMCHLCVCVE